MSAYDPHHRRPEDEDVNAPTPSDPNPNPDPGRSRAILIMVVGLLAILALLWVIAALIG